MVTGPNGCGKSFLVDKIAQHFHVVIRIPTVRSLYRRDLHISNRSKTLVLIDDVLDCTPELMRYLSGEINGNDADASSKKKKKKRVITSTPSKLCFLFVTVDMYTLPKNYNWVRRLRSVRLYKAFDSDVKRFAYRELYHLCRNPKDVDKAVRTCNGNLSQIRTLLEYSCAAKVDTRMNVFDESRHVMSTRFKSYKIGETSAAIVHANAPDNVESIEQLANVLDTMSLADTMQHNKYGECLEANSFASNKAAGKDFTVSFPSEEFAIERTIRRNKEITREMGLFWLSFGSSKHNLSMDELSILHRETLPNLLQHDIHSVLYKQKQLNDNLIADASTMFFQSRLH